MYPVWTDNRTGTALAYTSPFVLGCVDDITLQNTTIPTGTSKTYQAANTITATTVTVEGSTTFEAGQSIVWKPGFFAKAGSSVTASIKACDAGATLMADASVEENSVVSLELSQEDIAVSPNPNQGKFKLEFLVSVNKAQEFEKTTRYRRFVGVYDLMGVPVFEKELTNWKELDIDISHAEKGVYILRYSNGTQVFTKRIINEK